jgi:hypothetical protein
MSKEITLTIEELEKEIKQAFIHGQGNKEMMEAGLERDETEDYVNSRMRNLLKSNKDDEDHISSMLYGVDNNQ